MMYSIVKEFLEKLDSGDGDLIEYSRGDNRIALAVLLFRAMTADGRIRQAEIAKYHQILEDFLDVTADEQRLFEAMVRDESEHENSLSAFTAVVSKMPLETRKKVLSLMRDISVSDRELHEFEINLMARTAALLGLPLDE